MNINQIKSDLQSKLNPNRFAHSIGVADTAVELARRFNVNEEKAYIAGLLHDCARQFDDEHLFDEAVKRNIFIGEVEKQIPLLLHAYIGAVMVKDVYGIDDEEIISAVWRHTVGGPDMSDLDKIIYFADMIEPNRNYPGVDELRNIAHSAQLDVIILFALNESIKYVIQKNSLIHPDTISARNEFFIR